MSQRTILELLRVLDGHNKFPRLNSGSAVNIDLHKATRLRGYEATRLRGCKAEAVVVRAKHRQGCWKKDPPSSQISQAHFCEISNAPPYFSRRWGHDQHGKKAHHDRNSIRIALSSEADINEYRDDLIGDSLDISPSAPSHGKQKKGSLVRPSPL